MLAQKIIGFHEPLPRKGTETLVSDWLFILLYVSTNHYPARGLKRQPRSFCPSLPGFHEPLPRKGTETMNFATFAKKLLRFHEPLPRKGTETIH